MGRIGKFIFRFGVYLAVGLTLLIVDPFDLGNVTERYSEDLADLAFFGPRHGPGSQDDVTVVMLDDRSLDSLDLTWPVQLEWHARFLEALLLHKPGAVFVDILFLDQRTNSNVSDLLTVLQQYQDAGISIYFASFVENGELQVREDLRDHVKLVPLHVMEEARQTREYPLFVDVVDQAGKPVSRSASPAMQLYADLKSNEHAAIPASASAMRVIWAPEYHPINNKWMECAEVNPILERAWLAFWNPRDLRQTCPHVGLVPVEILFETPRDTDAENMIGGNAVFIGTSFTGTTDIVHAPVYGDIPGVYFHAMAFENLRHLNENYRRTEVHTLPGVSFSTDEINIGVAVLLILMLVLYLPFEDRLRHKVQVREKPSSKIEEEKEHAKLKGGTEGQAWNVLGIRSKIGQIAMSGFLFVYLAALLLPQYFLARKGTASKIEEEKKPAAWEEKEDDRTWNIIGIQFKIRQITRTCFLVVSLVGVLLVQYVLATQLNLAVGNWLGLSALIILLGILSKFRPAEKLLQALEFIARNVSRNTGEKIEKRQLEQA